MPRTSSHVACGLDLAWARTAPQLRHRTFSSSKAVTGLLARGARCPQAAHSAVANAAVPNQGRDASRRSGCCGTALNEVVRPPRLRVCATEPSVLGSQRVELTLQADDAVTERGKASVHGELPGLRDWRLRKRVARQVFGCSVRSMEVQGVAAD
jgi:hypothetical protein